MIQLECSESIVAFELVAVAVAPVHDAVGCFRICVIVNRDRAVCKAIGVVIQHIIWGAEW